MNKFGRKNLLVMYILMISVLLTVVVSYGLAYGAGWQQRMTERLSVYLIMFGIMTVIYWVLAVMIALINAWWIRRGFAHGRRHSMVQVNDEAIITKNQLHAFSESFRKLSQSFEMDNDQRSRLNQRELQDIFNAVTEQVCKDCSRCTYCWENISTDSCTAAYEILDLCMKKTELKKKDLPERFRQRCVRSDNFLAEAKRMVGLAQTNLAWQNRLSQSRIALAGQFGEVADVIGNFSEQIGEESVKQGSPEKQIVRRLSGKQMKVRRIAVSKKANGRRCVYMEARTTKDNERSVKETADIIGRVYGQRYLPISETPAVIGKKWQTMAFQEDVRYRTILGDARMVRMGEAVSGDSYTVMNMDSGQLVMSLSDGMGCGEDAQKESNRMISLLEQLLTTGFSRQSAIRLIHSMVLAGSEQHTYSTLDMATIDLYNGNCEFVKMGAAASYIKNGDEVRRIMSNALPPGVLSEPQSEVVVENMDDEDMLIMMSDGVFNSLGSGDGEEKMEIFLKSCHTAGPQELANMILNHAMASCHYEAEDDMTVLVCGLYRKPRL